ncbi:MAG: translational GTPase TypA [Heliobacteriaceae bacterium]|nr:translational GTPase TypA [Heliobacteriaceae bacterium]
MFRSDLRNVAIIAHVDHGKTTLVDGMLRQAGIFRHNQAVVERVMDSNDLERERGITILSKNTAIKYKGVTINIVDTPGHADFGGEVERVLQMVDAALLVVDAFEGPMPQTRFVLKKALAARLKPIVVINKMDRAKARPKAVVDEVLDLFIDLGATEDQLDFPVLYTSARQGIADTDEAMHSTDLQPLFEAIIREVPQLPDRSGDPLQLLVTTLDYDDYIGRIAIGRITAGVLTTGQEVSILAKDREARKERISRIYELHGLTRNEIPTARSGDIVAVTGISDIGVGETIACPNEPKALESTAVDEPTLTMDFMVNDSPFAGLEGTQVTSRKLKGRLFKELETNVSLRVENTDAADVFRVSGRGELHLSILVETMRREGFEFQVSRPGVIYRHSEEGILEPLEHLICDVPEEYVGVIMESLGSRRAEMINMTSAGSSTQRLEFTVPARGLIGFRSQFLTETRGLGTMNHVFWGYGKHRGEIPSRNNGVLIAFESGEATTYALLSAQDRGRFFINPGTKVYTGMIVGQNTRDVDLEVNVCRKKQMTNMRSSTSEETVRLEPARILSLEEALAYIADDELVEVTPQTIRLRKKYLEHSERVRAAKRKNQA